MANENDPKQAAKEARKHPDVERMLRQFLNHDGAKGATQGYRAGYDAAFQGKVSRCSDVPGYECYEGEGGRCFKCGEVMP